MPASDSRKKIAINPPVFFVSGGLLALFLILGVAIPDQAASVFPKMLDWVTSTFGWLYVAAVVTYFSVAVWLVFSRYGKLRLGQDDRTAGGEPKRPGRAGHLLRDAPGLPASS